jgi:hydrogenase maturation protease
MLRALIIGYGNPLRGDDQLGWHVADRVAESVEDFGKLSRADNSTKVIAVHQLTPELAEAISEAELVIFVDASLDGRPGSWRCDTIRRDTVASNAFAHYCTPATLLDYAETIFKARPRSLLISVAAESFDCGDQLTPNAQAVLPEIVQFICEQISCPSQIPD